MQYSCQVAVFTENAVWIRVSLLVEMVIIERFNP
jgi:hypothetical protein